MFNNLKLIKPLTTSQVFDIWRDIEEPLEHWKGFWKTKGFKNWEEWRKQSHAPVLEKNLSWDLYLINNPLTEIPQWRGIMSHSWNKWFYPQFPEKPPRLKELLIHPGVHNHWYIREIANNLPASTTLTALHMSNGDIVVAEGMHRACAITMLAFDKKPLNTDVFVIIADWPDNEPPKLGTSWKSDVEK